MHVRSVGVRSILGWVGLGWVVLTPYSLLLIEEKKEVGVERESERERDL